MRKAYLCTCTWTLGELVNTSFRMYFWCIACTVYFQSAFYALLPFHSLSQWAFFYIAAYLLMQIKKQQLYIYFLGFKCFQRPGSYIPMPYIIQFIPAFEVLILWLSLLGKVMFTKNWKLCWLNLNWHNNEFLTLQAITKGKSILELKRWLEYSRISSN